MGPIFGPVVRYVVRAGERFRILARASSLTRLRLSMAAALSFSLKTSIMSDKKASSRRSSFRPTGPPVRRIAF